MLLHKQKMASAVLFLFVMAVVDVPLLFAQQQMSLPNDYRVGAGDHIFVSVPQRPDLNREYVINERGALDIPLIGEVQVSGLTSEQIEVKLLEALRDYYPSLTRIAVTITQALSQVIYVTGQVRNPGKFNYSSTKNLWDAIREAGGPLAEASLDQVRIVKDRSRGGRSLVVNVLAAMESGSIESLPDLEPGDTIIIPAQTDVYTGSFGVNVFGAVVKPGVYRLQSREDLVTAILQAGGPNSIADLSKIHIIRPQVDGSTVTIKVNLKKFLEDGDPASNPKLKPGDTVNLPARGRLGQVAAMEVRTFISLVSAVATITLIAVTIRSRTSNN